MSSCTQSKSWNMMDSTEFLRPQSPYSQELLGPIGTNRSPSLGLWSTQMMLLDTYLSSHLQHKLSMCSLASKLYTQMHSHHSHQLSPPWQMEFHFVYRIASCRHPQSSSELQMDWHRPQHTQTCHHAQSYSHHTTTPQYRWSGILAKCPTM